jgi:hypothetical protein
MCSPQYQETLVETGVMRRVLTAMDAHFSNAGVLHAAAALIWNITEVPDVAAAVLSTNPLPRVFQVCE